MRQCTRCVMDETASSISFDEQGVCNFCNDFEKDAASTFRLPAEKRSEIIQEMVREVKEFGKGKEYDCIIGLSGGVDSSYVAYLAWKWGLKPLAVHFDNGWNSELAVQNIHNIIEKTGFDLYTYVVNWEEFKDLQLAYLKSSVLDIEAPTDHMIFAAMRMIAAKRNIKYVLAGMNVATEGILPFEWTSNKVDLVNLKAIHKKFGKVKLREFPKLGFYQRYYYDVIKKLKVLYPLNFVDYNKAAAKQTIINEFGWRDYGGKHYESVWTKFYQGYILPKKFNVDKRKAHLSTLINSGQITKEAALSELSNPPIPPSEERELVEYVIKKFGITQQEFDQMMKQPPVDQLSYGSESDERIKKKHERFTITTGFILRMMRKLKLAAD